jgi:hypothetical protein
MKCISNKRVYQSHQLAVEALVSAWSRYDYAPGHGPIAVYLCEECGYFHLTSKGVMNETLARKLKEGSIKLQKEADDWLDKIKKR